MSLVSGTMIAIFGFMLDRSTFPLGYQIVFMISFGASLMNTYYFSKVEVTPFVREPDEAQPGQSTTGETDAPLPRLVRLRHFLRAFTAHPAFVRFNASSFAFRLTLMMPAGLFSVYWVNTLHASDAWIGLRGTAGYAALVLGYWFWGRMASRIGHRGLLLMCGAGLAFYPVLTALAPSVAWLLPAAVLWGFTVSGVDIGLFDMMLISSPAGRMPSLCGPDECAEQHRAGDRPAARRGVGGYGGHTDGAAGHRRPATGRHARFSAAAEPRTGEGDGAT